MAASNETTKASMTERVSIKHQPSPEAMKSS